MTALPPPGTRVTFRWRKWDGRRHWTRDVVYLGEDDFGRWVGQRSGWTSERPELSTTSRGDAVTVLAPDGTYAATTWRGHPRVRIYIDVGWHVGWEDGEPVGIDMDLDVVRRTDGEVFLDDEDEWQEHQVLFGYPQEVIDRLEKVADELLARVSAWEAPFDDATVDRWFAVLDAVTGTDTDLDSKDE